MKIGVIYCCYGNPEYIDNCLKPWIEARKTHDILIAAVHGQFKEYHDMGIPDNDLDSKGILNILHREGDIIDHLYIQNDYTGFSHWQTEAEIRDKGLQWLLGQNCDIIWLLDNDEFYIEEQIKKIIDYIQKDDNKFYDWFAIPFKNYVFTKTQWIDGFCPPRIFRVNGSRHSKLSSFYFDNDVLYYPGLNYKDMPNKNIPKSLICGGICHLTWLDNEDSHNKVLYHETHFKHGAGCSYKWENGHLCFNEEYYKKIGQSLPIINRDE